MNAIGCSVLVLLFASVVLAADPVDRTFDFLRWTIKHRFARRQQQPAVFWNALEQFHLLLRNAFAVAERRHMGQADIGKNAVVGPSDFFHISLPSISKQNRPSEPKIVTIRCPSVAGVELQ